MGEMFDKSSQDSKQPKRMELDISEKVRNPEPSGNWSKVGDLEFMLRWVFVSPDFIVFLRVYCCLSKFTHKIDKWYIYLWTCVKRTVE